MTQEQAEQLVKNTSSIKLMKKISDGIYSEAETIMLLNANGGE